MDRVVWRFRTSKFVKKTQAIMSPVEQSLKYKREDKPIFDYIDPGLYLPRDRRTWIPTPVKKFKFQGPIVNVDEKTFPNLKSHLEAILHLFINLCNALFPSIPETSYWVIKAEAYCLDSPGVETIQGELHREGGVGYEDIAAVGIYYYQVDKTLKGGELCLESQFGQDVLEVKSGQMILFDNSHYLHRMLPLSGHGQRKFLAFFLVRNASEIGHTGNTDVNHHLVWRDHLLSFFPGDLAALIVSYGYTLESALEVRKELRYARMKKYRVRDFLLQLSSEVPFSERYETDYESQSETDDEDTEEDRNFICNED
jgi:hypothetical protein